MALTSQEAYRLLRETFALGDVLDRAQRIELVLDCTHPHPQPAMVHATLLLEPLQLAESGEDVIVEHKTYTLVEHELVPPE